MTILKNKGMYLETLINKWCFQINESGVASINKIPVNYDLLEVNNNLISGVIKKNDNCDYIGIYKGFYVEFDAKETEKEYFCCNNIKKHQMIKLEKINKLGGIGFLIIYFHIYDRYFVISIDEIMKYKNKNIPIAWFEINAIEIFLTNLNLNIEKAIDRLIP